MCLFICMLPWRPKEGLKSIGDGVTGVCELPDVGAGIVMKEQQCSQLLIYLFSPSMPLVF